LNRPSSGGKAWLATPTSGYSRPPAWTDEPSAAFVALGAKYAEPEETWQAAIAWLDDLSSVPGTVRERYYELGAAEAYLLDRLMPGWQPRAFPGGESLEVLLAAALAAREQGLPTGQLPADRGRQDHRI
jgi:hypothetical protein